jgi:hypothetical protein
VQGGRAGPAGAGGLAAAGAADDDAAQRDPAKRSSALAMVVFGIGAGLRPGELVALRGSDVTRRGRQVMVQVSGPAARVVPVTSRYAGRAGELARRAGSGHVFRPGPAERSYKNFVTNFARGLAADPAAPALSMRRAPVRRDRAPIVMTAFRRLLDVIGDSCSASQGADLIAARRSAPLPDSPLARVARC